jgi:hypothetical protein
MRVRRLAAAAIALGLAAWLAAGGRPSSGPRTDAAGAMLGGGSADALLAAPLPVLRFALPAGGRASLRLGLRVAPTAEVALAADLALVALLGVPGEWPLEAGLAERPRLGAAAPALASAPAPVPEPSALVLLLVGAGGLAALRVPARRPAGPGPPRSSS